MTGPDEKEPSEPEEDLRSRTDARYERKQSEDALMDLAKTLLDLNEKTTEKLGLPDDLVAALRDTRRLRTAAAVNRGRRLVRAALRDADQALIRRQLARLQEPPRVARSLSAAEGWRERLLASGEEEINALVAEFPDADRQRFRQLVRNAKKSEGAARAAKLRALTDALEALFG